jgi:hypothetical protein
MAICMVEQLGLAMMAPRPPAPTSVSMWPLISGTTRGTWGSMRKADELSTTRQPASLATGPH